MTDDQFDKLAQLIKWTHDDLSAEMDTRFNQVDTKFDQVDARFEQVDARFEQVDARFDKLEQNMTYILAELRDIRHDLEMLKEKTTNHSGFSKEIDHALARILAIEKHVGLQAVA